MSDPWLLLGLFVLSVSSRVGWETFSWKQLKQFGASTTFQRTNRLIRFGYFVGLPYLGLLFGWLTPSLLGLRGLEYFTLMDLTGANVVLQFLQALTLMLVAWLLDGGATLAAGLAAALSLFCFCRALTRQGVELGGLQQALLDVIYYTLHWAFYRATFWALTGDLYLGTVLGIGAVMLEWILIERLKGRWPFLEQQFLLNTVVLVLTATVFFYSPNLWLLIPFHWAMVAILNKASRPHRHQQPLSPLTSQTDTHPALHPRADR